MDFLNSIILQKIKDGTHVQAYGMAGTIGQILLFVVVLWYVWRMRLHPLKAIPVAYLGYLFTSVWNGFLLTVLSGLQSNSSNLAVAFVYLLPVSWLFAKLFRMPWHTVSELITFGVLAFHVAGRSGCIFTGCCYGYPCEWGLYSLATGYKVFPIVIVESLMTFGILLFLLIRTQRKSYVPDGKTLPWMLLLYGVGRFVTEFFRDNDKIFIGCSDIAFHALFMAVVGGGMLWLLFYSQRAFKSAKH